MRVLSVSSACRTARRVFVSPFINNELMIREELMKRLGSLVLAVAMALAFLPLAVRADMNALVEAAKKEGEITWHVAHYTSEGAEDLGRGFTEMYGIKVNVVRTTAQVAYQR